MTIIELDAKLDSISGDFKIVQKAVKVVISSLSDIEMYQILDKVYYAGYSANGVTLEKCKRESMMRQLYDAWRFGKIKKTISRN